MKKIGFFFLFLFVVFGMVAEAQNAGFSLIDSSHVYNYGITVADTGYVGNGYRLQMQTDYSQPTPNITAYTMWAKTYVPRNVPVAIRITMRAPLWTSGVTRVAVGVDDGNGNNNATSQFAYVYPSSDWKTYQFVLAGATSGTVSDFRAAFSYVTGDAGTRVVFFDNITYVYADSSTVVVDDGSGTGSITTLAAPVLGTPANGGTSISITPTYQWNSVSNATAYEIQVISGSTVVMTNTNVSAVSYQFPQSLQNNTLYYWRVRAWNGSVSSDWSPTWSFTTVNVVVTTPGVVTLVSPQNNSVGVSLNVSASWNTASNAATYDVQVSTNSSFMFVVFSMDNVSGTSIVFQNLQNATTYYWRVRGVASDGTDGPWSNVWNFLTVGGVTGVSAGEAVPARFDLSQNYPNPFNPSTAIRYSIAKTSQVTLKVYDVLGKEVAVLVNGEKQPGLYEANFDASKFASGLYIYKLTAGNFTSIKKMLLLK